MLTFKQSSANSKTGRVTSPTKRRSEEALWCEEVFMVHGTRWRRCCFRNCLQHSSHPAQTMLNNKCPLCTCTVSFRFPFHDISVTSVSSDFCLNCHLSASLAYSSWLFNQTMKWLQILAEQSPPHCSSEVLIHWREGGRKEEGKIWWKWKKAEKSKEENNMLEHYKQGKRGW